MANPIPTQLSPGVNVSEIDLSQFIVPEGLNVGGMVGIFNWGPGLVATNISTESNLATIFGKPTSDASAVDGNQDFNAAANFLRYSSPLKVIRAIKAGEVNATSDDAGVTWIGSVDQRTIRNIDQFRTLGGFSAGDGIETKAYFKARYPGTFGNSLRVVLFDGGTSDSVSTPAYSDFTLLGGYAGAITGVSSGNYGVTYTGFSDRGSGAQQSSAGVSFESIPWFTVTVQPKVAATEFISTVNQDINKFNILYARGTTAQNFTLTGTGSNPDGNAANYYAAERFAPGDGDHRFNPFYHYGIPGNIFCRLNTTNSNFVDILFLNGDYSNMGTRFRTGSPDPGNTAFTISRVEVVSESGLPSNFQPLFVEPSSPQSVQTSNFENYVINWSRAGEELIGSAPSGTVKGWAQLIGITGGRSYKRRIDQDSSNIETVGITFDVTGGITGVRNNLKFGIVQFGVRSDSSSTTTSSGEPFSSSKLFGSIPATSSYALSQGGSNDEISIAVVDAGGKFGTKGSILERFELLSKASDAKNLDGESIFYKDYINTNSQFVYMTKVLPYQGGLGNSTSLASTVFGDITSQKVGADGITYTRVGSYDTQLKFGDSAGNSAATLSELMAAYSLFAQDDNAADIIFIPESSVSNDLSQSQTVLESQVFDTVIEPRKDTILVIPTAPPAGFNPNSGIVAANAVKFRKTNLTIPSNSYTVLVAGRKIFFDTYNSQTRKMSLSSDIAGIMCGQEVFWESPAGFARGNLRNVIRLETQFTKDDRDELYKNQINFFNEFADGSGTVLFGDKTLLVKNSAFDRINVRRVFISIEKAIARAAKFSLFEFNDEFTRSQFRNLVNPFLNSLVGQRAIADFKVVCDETNNTAQVIDSNQFVADIYIKPQKSINFIQLNFIATRSDFNLQTLE
jgi:hypothetical protein